MNISIPILIVFTCFGFVHPASASDKDAETIEQLKKLGDKLDKEHAVDFFFYGSSDKAEICLSKSLDSEGLRSKPGKSEGTFSKSMKICKRSIMPICQVLI
jgi:hypothetical protein